MQGSAQKRQAPKVGVNFSADQTDIDLFFLTATRTIMPDQQKPRPDSIGQGMSGRDKPISGGNKRTFAPENGTHFTSGKIVDDRPQRDHAGVRDRDGEPVPDD